MTRLVRTHIEGFIQSNGPFLLELRQALGPHGFNEVSLESNSVMDCVLLLKRQTWNTNRAVVIVHPKLVPDDFGVYVRRVRRSAAFRCGFVPFFWGIGIQLIVICPRVVESEIEPSQYVASFDNQWAIIQSLFLVDTDTKAYRSARSWGQIITGKFQDAITSVLERYFQALQG